MIIDSLNEFCDATALDTTGTGRDLLGDVIDLGGGTGPDGVTTFAPHDLGNGKPMYWIVQVTTAFTTGGTSEVGFELATDAAAAIATNGTATVHIATPVLDSGTWVAGYTLCIPLPVGVDLPYERYLGILQNTTTAAVTGGAINSFLSFDPVGTRYLPDANN
jgi:hypothetical protein